LVSHSADYLEQMYFIHNAMADVFCTYEAEDRRPQGLRFQLVMNNTGSALYLEADALSMSTEEYIVYLSERPEFSCKPPGTLLAPEEIKLTEDEMLHFKNYSGDLMDQKLKSIDHISEVGLVLFSADLKQIYMVQQWDNPTHWSIPHGRRYPEETDWETLRRIAKEQLGLHEGLTFEEGGGFFDHDKTRIWVKQTRQTLDFQPNKEYQSGRWVEYSQLGLDKYIFLDRPARSMIQFLANHKHIPPLIKESESLLDWQRKFETWQKQHQNKKIAVK
jgi:ADP-ribose pyrophosphatase YjhB (NUDIX family)